MIVEKTLKSFNKSEQITQEDLNPHELNTFYSLYNKYLNIEKIESAGILLIKRKSLQQYVGLINFKDKIRIYIPTIIPVEKIFQIWVFTHINLEFDKFNEFLKFKSSKNSLEYIIDLYYNYLSELLRKGLNKNYEDINLNTRSPKGKINIQHTIVKHFKNFKFNIYCNIKIFIEDNLFNQIIKFCLVRLIRISNGKLKSRGKKFLFSFQKVTTLTKINPSVFNQLTYNRLNKKYEFILILSNFIIQNSIICESEGGFRFFSFLIDINTLFEDFVFKVIDKFKPFGYDNPKSKESFNTENNVQLIPDIIIKKDNQIVLAIDCKFKTNISRGDKFQIVTYGNYFNLKKGILICPKNETEINEKFTDTNSIKIIQNKQEFFIIIKLIDLEKLSETALSAFTKNLFKLAKKDSSIKVS
ncbi:MAG: hypothetical protein V3V33_10155 [Candidatus Lokiarchaeia archaeon]